MKNLVLALVLVAAPYVAFATESPDTEMKNYQKSIYDAFRDFPDKPQAGSLSSGSYNSSSRGKKGSDPFTTANVNKAAQSPYAKSELMKTIGKLALAWAQSAGSMQGLQSSNQAGNLATVLSNSNDKDFQQMGGLLNQESSSIAQGNRPMSEQFASQIGSIQRPYVPAGYTPTKGEDWLVSAFNMAAGGVISSLTGVLGALVVKDLLSGLGLDPSSWSMGLGSSMGSNLGRAAVNGQSASPVLQGGAQSSINQGSNSLSGTIQKSSGSIINTNPVQSSQTGSVPGAGQ